MAQAKPAAPPAPIDSELSLDLRIRWLETILYGAKQDMKDRQIPKTNDPKFTSLVRRVEDLQRRLEGIVQSSEGVRRFMDHYEQHSHLLTPSFALASVIPTAPPPYENMSPSEVEAFLAEMESDIRAADRDLREIEILEKKDVTSAGKLAYYESLKPRLEHLIQAHEEDQELATDLEQRVSALMERYATNVDTLSELFVAWNDTIEGAEDEIGSMERDFTERRRLGFD